MEPQVFLRIFLTLSKTKLQKQEVFQIRILSIKELSCVRTTRFMHMDTRMILLTSTICKRKLGLRND